jgi:hypothetical protein
VKGCRAGTLFICADNAAVAAKLKQLAPRLLAAIRENEAEINQIRIEVQVGGRAGAGLYTSRKTPLTPATIQRFGALAQAIPEGGLKAAISRLAARHSATLDEHESLEHVQHHRHDRNHEGELDRTPRPGQVTAVAGVKEKAERKRHRK